MEKSKGGGKERKREEWVLLSGCPISTGPTS
ncbi:hypothetical protein Taro_024003 [Colocasia esculenta]|uniref:Uncharacterized protein n=1 Tax=Colocasia esculenta TaxID=4460 RepID=A0A843UZ20_COLES|nr:hypothetical protein [Colocasia esculenta]